MLSIVPRAEVWGGRECLNRRIWHKPPRGDAPTRGWEAGRPNLSPLVVVEGANEGPNGDTPVDRFIHADTLSLSPSFPPRNAFLGRGMPLGMRFGILSAIASGIVPEVPRR